MEMRKLLPLFLGLFLVLGLIACGAGEQPEPASEVKSETEDSKEIAAPAEQISGNWLDGARFGGNISEDELRSWIEGMD